VLAAARTADVPSLLHAVSSLVTLLLLLLLLVMLLAGHQMLQALLNTA
jgi:hypothetical protein